MFESLLEAHRILEERFAGIEMQPVLDQLEPVIVFAPRAVDRPGGSRIGGMPDLSEGMGWPRRPVPVDTDEIAARGGPEHAPDLRQHLASGLSYTFMGQVDLGEAIALGEVANDLPTEGRLVFFYDMIAGPFDTGTEAARIIWDRGPTADLVAAPLPQDLAEAASKYRQAIDEINQQYGLETQQPASGDDVLGSPYGTAPQPMMLKTMLQLPVSATLEFQATGRLEKVYSADRAVLGGEQSFSQSYDDLSEPYDRGHQLLGLPVPAQDDPRYDAVVEREYGVQHLGAEQWANNKDEIFGSARDWKLLLQIEIADWMQQSAEGTVYFLIQREDLRDRAFDCVVAVYQQT